MPINFTSNLNSNLSKTVESIALTEKAAAIGARLISPKLQLW